MKFDKPYWAYINQKGRVQWGYESPMIEETRKILVACNKSFLRRHDKINVRIGKIIIKETK